MTVKQLTDQLNALDPSAVVMLSVGDTTMEVEVVSDDKGGEVVLFPDNGGD